MAQAEHLPIYKASYDLCLYLERVTRSFVRAHKYTLGADLRDGTRRVLEPEVGAVLMKALEAAPDALYRKADENVPAGTSQRLACAATRVVMQHGCNPGRGGARSGVADDFAQSLKHARNLFRRGVSDLATDPLDREGSYLADLDPRSLGQTLCPTLERQGESGARLLARECDRDYRSRAVVEDVVAEDQDGTQASLQLMKALRID